MIGYMDYLGSLSALTSARKAVKHQVYVRFTIKPDGAREGTLSCCELRMGWVFGCEFFARTHMHAHHASTGRNPRDALLLLCSLGSAPARCIGNIGKINN